MKALLLLSLLFANHLLSAQTYQPFAVAGAKWFVHDEYIDNRVDTYYYFIDGDTLIDGTSYRKVYVRALEYDGPLGGFGPPYSYQSARTLHGVVRDEPATRRVYGRVFDELPYGLCPDSVGAEVLLYDFSLTAGEELIGCPHAGSYVGPDGDTLFYSPTIDSVGATTWRDVAHATQYLPNTGGPDRLIEGIGGDLGPFTPTATVFIPGIVITLADYCVGTEVACGLQPTGATDLALDQGLSVAPNPATEALTLSLPTTSAGPLSVQLHDLTGRTRYRLGGLTPLAFPLTLPVGHLAPGMYALTVRGPRGLATRRVVVE